ncbi:MAG: hypothetical protein HIU57_06935 [Acidobacteria bacterium]|nr:hypothetical protein [Acidobacteriota bacterium]
MYRPKKRKLVRGVSAASVVAVGAAVGLGITILHQTGATTSAIATSGEVTATTTTPAPNPSASTAVTPTYHIVGLARHHDDANSSPDD